MKTAKWMMVFFWVTLVMNVPGYAQMPESDALSDFVAAGMAYKEGRYNAAIGSYQKILDGGRESGALYYNLGNSYYKKGNKGKALLNYERARRFIPRDSDLKFNHRYVQSQKGYYGNEQEFGFAGRLLNNFIQFYTIDEFVLIVTSTIAAIGILFLFSFYWSWPRQAVGLTMGALSLLLFLSVVGLTLKTEQDRNQAIMMTATNSYFEPRTDSTVYFKLSEGAKVKIVKPEGHWVKIQRPDGKVGWVDFDSLEKI